MNEYIANSISLSFVIGAAIIIIAHLISDPILRLINTPDNIFELSSSYINILYFGVPIQMLFNNFVGIARALGDSKRPLYFLIVSVFFNLVLDLLFVKTFGMGVQGAAIATVLSNGIACVFTAWYVVKNFSIINLNIKSLKLKWKISAEQLKLGIPVSLQFTITSIGSMILQTAINGVLP